MSLIVDHNDTMPKRPYYVGITMPTSTLVEAPCPPIVINKIEIYDRNMTQYMK